MFTIQMIFKASALLVLLLTWAACLCWSACLVINYALAKSGRQGKACELPPHGQQRTHQGHAHRAHPHHQLNGKRIMKLDRIERTVQFGHHRKNRR